MNKLKEREKLFLGLYKRKFSNFDETFNEYFGYITCMVDNGIITEKQANNFCVEFTQKLLKIRS